MVINLENRYLSPFTFQCREVFSLFNAACAEALSCGSDLCLDEVLFPNHGMVSKNNLANSQQQSKYFLLYKAILPTQLL